MYISIIFEIYPKTNELAPIAGSNLLNLNFISIKLGWVTWKKKILFCSYKIVK